MKKTIKKLINKIIRIIEWIPILWKDRDFDHSYLITILRYKLERMYKFLTGKQAMAKHNKKEIQALRICIEILKRKENDFYFNTFVYLIDNPARFISIDEETKENLANEGVINTSELLMLDPMWKISSNMEAYDEKSKLADQAQKDRDKLLYKLLELYVESWWD